MRMSVPEQKKGVHPPAKPLVENASGGLVGEGSVRRKQDAPLLQGFDDEEDRFKRDGYSECRCGLLAGFGRP